MIIKKILFSFAIGLNVLAVFYGARLLITKLDSALVKQFSNNPEKYTLPTTGEEKKYGKTLLIIGIISLSGLLSAKVVQQTLKSQVKKGITSSIWLCSIYFFYKKSCIDIICSFFYNDSNQT